MNRKHNMKSAKRYSSPKWVRTVHIYTSLFILVSMLFFTATGITLNHRDWFSASGKTHSLTLDIPEQWQNPDQWQDDPLAVASELRSWLKREYGVTGNKVSYEWEESEQVLVIDVKRPGGYSLVEADIESGELFVDNHTGGFISTMNDLHMGRYSGEIWQAFIDLSAIIMLLFTLTGLWLAIPQKRRRALIVGLTTAGAGTMLAAYSFIFIF